MGRTAARSRCRLWGPPGAARPKATCHAGPGQVTPARPREGDPKPWLQAAPASRVHRSPKPQLRPFPPALLHLQAAPHHHPWQRVLLAPVHRAEEAAAPWWTCLLAPVQKSLLLSRHILFESLFSVCVFAVNQPTFVFHRLFSFCSQSWSYFFLDRTSCRPALLWKTQISGVHHLRLSDKAAPLPQAASSI